jgi:hypothetical protein
LPVSVIAVGGPLMGMARAVPAEPTETLFLNLRRFRARHVSALATVPRRVARLCSYR